MSNNDSGLRTWTKEQKFDLRQHLDAGLSSTEAAAKINAKFGTAFSRCAVLGFAKRQNIKLCCTKADRGEAKVQVPRRKATSADYSQIQRISQHTRTPRPTQEQIVMRCAEVDPLHLALLDLEPGMCRYPYGDGPYTFCGHPQRDKSSYCGPHTDITANHHPNIGHQAPPQTVAAVTRANRPTVFTLVRDIQGAGVGEEA